MNLQAIHSDHYRLPNWWVWLLPEFVGQPKHTELVFVTGKQHRPACNTSVPGGFCTPNIRVTIKESWTLQVQTRHGACKLQVSKALYNLMTIDDTVPAEYRLSRLFAYNQSISGKILV